MKRARKRCRPEVILRETENHTVTGATERCSDRAATVTEASSRTRSMKDRPDRFKLAVPHTILNSRGNVPNRHIVTYY
uniref:Uncharacterized protein n=1 Tax=Caenorhabditis japonica TaxID=281687 RepID=A0A8R1IA51_CAEJA